MPRQPKTISVDIALNYHEVYFAVQEAFQKNGVALVDLDTNKIIKGQVNLTDIGLIRQEKIKPKVIRSFGFISKPETVAESEADQIEATLSILSNLESDTVPVLICVINANDVPEWLPIVGQVAANFVQVSKRKTYQLATFAIETLCLPDPDDPQSAIKTMLARIQKYRSSSAYAVSDQEIPLSDDDFDDDE